MGITFDQDTRTFHLQAKDTSYVFQATPGGYLVHLYWGKKVRPAGSCPFWATNFGPDSTSLPCRCCGRLKS